MGADLTTMPPRVCIQVAILMLAMSFALAESNSAPDWIGGCKTPKGVKPNEKSSDSGCPKECLSGDESHTKCAGKCPHKWEYSSNKGPYVCKKTARLKGHTATCQEHQKRYRTTFKDETLWCPKEVQTDVAKALQSIKDAKGRFPDMKEYKTSPVKHELQAKECKPTKYGETEPVPLKFMTSEPHRKYETDSKKVQAHEKRKKRPRWSNFGNGIEMYPWVKPGISNCSPDTPENFINYYEDLKSYAHTEDRVGKDCFTISRRNTDKSKKVQFKDKKGKNQSIKEGTAQLLHQAGRDKVNKEGIKLKSRRRSSRYSTLKIQLTMKMKKANMCERMWRHLPYTCSVKKMTKPIVAVVKGCTTYDGGRHSYKARRRWQGKPYRVGQGDNSGAPPKALCDHYIKYFPKGHQMNIGMPDFKPIPDFKGSVSGSWNKFTIPAPSIPHVAAIEAAVKAFVAM